jgi:hypothetical protein
MSHTAYLDSSALAKLVIAEAESRALTSFIRGASPVYTSALSEVELPRVIRRAAGGNRSPNSVRRLLERCEIVEIDAAVRAAAADAEPAALGSLDAIHLASALRVQDLLDVFVTYDRRLAVAAGDVGFEVVSPGRD